MIFNSLTFIIFLTIVVTAYWFLNTRYRLWLIFLSSITFYGFWRIEFVSLVLLSTVLDYFVANKIDSINIHKKNKRKRLLLLSIIINLGLLIYFKYSYFIVDNLNFIFSFNNGNFQIDLPSIILPLGISFYTFQTISYSVDVYRGHISAEKNFALYASYVTFFPQLVAGPILRASEVTSQLSVRPKFKFNFVTNGLKRILFGFFLKVVLADNISVFVDEGFNIDPNSLGGLDVWTLAFLFGFQIYFDFAGYSHIAIGCAKLMGLSFPENFNFPYASSSLKSFWKRWHISLSSWIRDYVYLPILGVKVIDKEKKSQGGISINLNESNNFKKNKALFITWAIMGLWHGSNWTFVFWGIYHALAIYFERVLKPLRNKIQILQNPFIGFSITIPVAMLSWIPFRAVDMNSTLIMFSKVFSFDSYFNLSMRENVYLITFCLFVSASLAYLYNNYLENYLKKYSSILITINTVKYSLMLYLVYTFFRPVSQFIYFQF